MKKKKYSIYAKHLEQIMLLTVLNLKSIIYMLIKRKIFSVFQKNIVQHTQLKKGNI